MKNIDHSSNNLWPILLGCVLPILVLIAPSYKNNLAEHMFSKSFIIQIYIAVLAVSYLIINRKKILLFPKNPLALTLYLTFSLGVFSLFWSANLGFSVAQLIKWVTGLLMAFLIYQVNEGKQQRVVLVLFFIGTVLLSVLGIIQYLFDVDIVRQAAKPASTFANKNMAAQVAVLTWILGVYLFISSDKSKTYSLVLYAFGTVFALVFIFYSQTQAAWLSTLAQLFLLSIVAVFLYLQKGKKIQWSHLHKNVMLGALFIFVALINLDKDGYKPFWEKIGQGAEKIVTRAADVEGEQATIRYVLWNGAIDMANDHPIKGLGLGNYYHYTQEYGNGRTHTIRSAHNDYLQATAELGYGIGIFIALCWIFLAIAFFRKLFSNTVDNLKDITLIIALGGLAITAIFSFPLQLQTPILIASTFVAMLLKSDAQSVQYTDRKYIVIIIGILLLAFTFVMNLSWNSKLSEFNQKIRSNDWKQKIDFDQGSAANHPMFRWFSQRVSKEYMYKSPGSSVSVSSSYLELKPDDVILLNNKIYSLISLKRYQEAEELIEKVRPLEPKGYYRSYYNDFILKTQSKQFEQLNILINNLDKEEMSLLSMKPETLDNMSVAAYNLKDLKRAMNYLKKNIEIHPNYEKSYEKMISMLKSSGKNEESEKYKFLLEELRLSK